MNLIWECRFKTIDTDFAIEAVLSIIYAALRSFHKVTVSVEMFNNAMIMIAGSVAYKNRIKFDVMG